MNMKSKVVAPLVVVGVALAVFVTLVLYGKITWFSDDRPVEFMANMDHQFKAIPQSGNNFFTDRKSLREPVVNTIARGQTVYPLAQGDIAEAENYNVNPGLPKTPFVLSRGQNRFNVFCSPCHNYNAQSDGRMAKRGVWPGIPNLTRTETKDLSNARIFHIISTGQGMMPSYADKISPVDRWAIIYYLRTLQGVPGVDRKPTTATTIASTSTTGTGI